MDYAKKELTVSGCCDNIAISSGTKQLRFGIHLFDITVVYCTNCGSVKTTSNIREKEYDR